MTNIRNSTGLIQEFEHMYGELLQAENHLQQSSVIDNSAMAEIQKIRSIRDSLLKIITDDIDLKYHCPYKHLISARSGLFDFKNQALMYNSELATTLCDIQYELNSLIHTVRAKYFKIDLNELEDKECMQCFEDYYLQQLTKNVTTQNTKEIENN